MSSPLINRVCYSLLALQRIGCDWVNNNMTIYSPILQFTWQVFFAILSVKSMFGTWDYLLLSLY